MRWACSGCLCLLSHTAFDNKITFTASLPETHSRFTGSDLDYELESVWKGCVVLYSRRASIVESIPPASPTEHKDESFQASVTADKIAVPCRVCLKPPHPQINDGARRSYFRSNLTLWSPGATPPRGSSATLTFPISQSMETVTAVTTLLHPSCGPPETTLIYPNHSQGAGAGARGLHLGSFGIYLKRGVCSASAVGLLPTS